MAICTSNASGPSAGNPVAHATRSSRRRTSNAGRGASSAVSAAFQGMRTTDTYDARPSGSLWPAAARSMRPSGWRSRYPRCHAADAPASMKPAFWSRASHERSGRYGSEMAASPGNECPGAFHRQLDQPPNAAQFADGGVGVASTPSLCKPLRQILFRDDYGPIASEAGHHP